MKIYDLYALPVTLGIGLTGSNRQREFAFDVRAWQQEYPGAVFAVCCRRPGDGADSAYFGDARTEGGILIWTVHRADLGVSAGNGKIEIWAVHPTGTVNDEPLYKSRAVITIVGQSIAETPSQTLPEAAKPWAQQVLDAAVEADQSAERAEAAKDEAEALIPGEGTPGNVLTKTEDGTAWMPGGGGGGVQTVNGYEGPDVVLDAEDVGAMPAATNTPANGQVPTAEDGAIVWKTPSQGTVDHRDLTNKDAADQHPINSITGLQSALDGKQPTISDLGAIRQGAVKGETAYQKPVGGIPKTDLTSAVQTSLGRADTALQTEIDTSLSVEGAVAEAKAVGDALSGKVDKNQGVANVGKIMMVGDGGVVAPFDIYTPSYDSITDIARVVRSNTLDINARLFPVGDQIVMPWKDLDDNNHNTDETAYQVAWDIVRHGIVTLQDRSQVPGMFLQMHKCSAYGVQFSHQQAFFQAFSEALPAGTYNVSFGVKYNDTFTAGTTGQFTLTQNLPIGGKLLLNGSKVEAWASATATAATESVDLTVGTGGTSLGSITSNNARSSDDLNAMYRIQYGHNRWSTSGIRQYLNAAGTGWFSSKEDFDIRPNEYAKHGFMAGFNSDFLNAIKPVKVTTALNTVEGYTETTEDTFDTFFPPSLQQMNVTPQLANVEGDAFDYWKRALGSQNFVGTGSANIFDAFKIPAINNNSAQNVRLRSALRGFAYDTWYVYSSGYVTSYYSASGAYRFSPVCVIC